jgi:hypothetical protein
LKTVKPLLNEIIYTINMIFTAIFLTSVALAQHAALFSYTAMPEHIKPEPGTCTPLHGIPIFRVFTTPDIGLKFYTGNQCNGDQIATATENNIEPRFTIIDARSVKTVYRHELND